MNHENIKQSILYNHSLNIHSHTIQPMDKHNATEPNHIHWINTDDNNNLIRGNNQNPTEEKDKLKEEP